MRVTLEDNGDEEEAPVIEELSTDDLLPRGFPAHTFEAAVPVVEATPFDDATDDPIDMDALRKRMHHVLTTQDPAETFALVQMLQANAHRLPPEFRQSAPHVFGSAPLPSAGRTPPPAGGSASLGGNRGVGVDGGAGDNSIVALLASHVANPTRLAYLRDCLASIAEQTVLPSTLIVGLSCDHAMQDELTKLLEGVAEDLARRGCLMRVRFSGVALSQFEHYAATLHYLDAMDGERTWLIFCDDDDLWHPRRVESYAAAARRAPPHVATLASPVYAVNVRPIAPGSPYVHPHDIHVKRFGAADRSDNYWALATRLRLWRDYFARTPPAELKSTYADVDFASAAKRPPQLPDGHGGGRGGECVLVEALGGDANWMYLWRQDHEGNPQHTEQQRSRHTPIVREALEQYFARPVNKQRFCADMAKAMGMPAAMLDGNGAGGGKGNGKSGGKGGGDVLSSSISQIATVEMMVTGFLEDMVAAESEVEIYRVGLRNGSMRLDALDLRRVGGGGVGGVGARGAEEDTLMRATLNPEGARTFEVERQMRAQPGPLGALGAHMIDHSTETMAAYKRMRLQLLAAKGFAYEPLSPKAVHEAFMRCMMDRSFM